VLIGGRGRFQHACRARGRAVHDGDDGNLHEEAGIIIAAGTHSSKQPFLFA
jgi:hypothetical protein